MDQHPLSTHPLSTHPLSANIDEHEGGKKVPTPFPSLSERVSCRGDGDNFPVKNLFGSLESKPADVDKETADSEPEYAKASLHYYKDLMLPELRVLCRDRGLNPGGGKEQLYERLTQAITSG